uniref:Uncharacterized protein n=1 Tax=Heterorhabditis bacteriophora TaxID=37862 RepID=A0A1I7XNN4_HETBA
MNKKDENIVNESIEMHRKSECASRIKNFCLSLRKTIRPEEILSSGRMSKYYSVLGYCNRECKQEIIARCPD